MTTRRSTSRLVIVPPAVYRYRERFYTLIHEMLDREGLHVQVAASSGPPAIAQRSDQTDGPWAVPVPVRWRTIAGREIARRDLNELMGSTPPEFVIVEHAIRNIETYPLVWRARLSGVSVGMWGHGATYTRQHSRPEAWVKRQLTRRTDWFFAYTDAGADTVAREGYPRARITTVNNSIDTQALRDSLAEVSEGTVARHRSELGLVPGRTALFLGGVDKSKGIDGLIEAASLAETRMPGFRLLVAGTGDRIDLVREAESRGAPVRALGRVDGNATAVALRLADIMVIPERVGLAVLDAMVAGLPLITYSNSAHGPEFSYGRSAECVIETGSEPAALAEAIVNLLSDEPLLHQKSTRAMSASFSYSAEAMAERFVDGVLKWRRSEAAKRA